MSGHWQLDGWELVGLLGEALFFARLLVQWFSSEKARKPVLPIMYWYMSLVGCAILIVYACAIGRPAVLLPQVVGVGLYARNLQLELQFRRRERHRQEIGLDRPEYPWPRLSVIVPAHNEVKVIGEAMENLLGQSYPAGKMEIIVALNGCTDGSAEVVRRYPVTIVEDERSGMSFGKNLGARAATGELLVFVDADTRLEVDGLRSLVESLHGKQQVIATMAGRPDRGGPVVRIAFLFANFQTCRQQLHAPGGVMAMSREVFAAVGGFDESLPQGTSSDFIMRARAYGAEYVYINNTVATTSIRRFEKTGIIGQMWSWRRNHRSLVSGQHDDVAHKRYDAVR